MNKLVRDKIPELIENQGQRAVTRILSEDEYLPALEAKLDEEVAEFHESGELEELADILEVVYALCAAKGYTKEQFDEVFKSKHEARGGFEKRIFLISKTQSALDKQSEI